MRYLVGLVLAVALMASPLSVSAQQTEEGTTPEPSAGEPAPTSEPAPEEPALQLKLDDAGVDVVPPPPRKPDGYTLKEMELRVRRAKIGFAVTLVLTSVAGIAVATAGFSSSSDPALVAGLAIMGAGTIASYATLGIWIHRKRKLGKQRREPEKASYEAIDVDTSDDAFTVIVTRKYERGNLAGASVLIRHKESGQHVNPYVDAAEIDSLEQVIREHKAKLLSNLGALEVQP